jgi:thiol-disulfide isomerase/thioredoxin
VLTVCVALAATGVVMAGRTDQKPNPKKKVPAAVERERAKRLGAATESEGTTATQPSGPHPVITCEEPIHDFGTIWVGPTLNHTFAIKNTGDAPLHISKVRPSCGCTVAGKYPRQIEPGESGTFPFSLMSTKVRNKFDKAITIKSNDPTNPSFRLRLRGEVKRYVEMVPPSAHFGKLSGEEEVTRVLRLMNNTDTPLDLNIRTKPKQNFDVSLKETVPGKEFELTVTAKPPFNSGAFREKVTLSTNLDKAKTLDVDVRGRVPQRLEVYPTVLSVRPTAKNAGQALPRVVRLNNYGNDPVSLLEATVDDPEVKVDVVEQRPGKAYMIRVEFPSGYTPPSQGRALTLKTDDKIRPEIKVPIRAIGTRDTSAQAKRERKRPAEQLVGQAVPSFAAQTLDGKPFSSGDLAGKVTVLDFFAVNCGFCKKQIPRVEKIRQEYESKGVRFVAVSQSMRNKKYPDEEVVDKIKELGFRGDLVTDPENQIGPLFKATGFPTMVVVGKSGKVDAVNVGNIGDLETRLRGQLDALLAGKPVPATAEAAAPPAKRERKRPGELLGKPAPRFALETLDGKPLNNDVLSASPATVLNFVATNCGYCGKQIPRLEKLREKYAAKGVRFVNVIETMRTKATVDQINAKMENLGWQAEVAHDPDNKVGPLFHATGFPTMIVLGKNGQVEAANVGNLGNLEERVTAQLDAIIAGKPVPVVAPQLTQKTPDKTPDRTPPKKKPAGDDGKPQPAPPFSITTVNGRSVTNDDLSQYAATVLNIVAPNCGYCKKQIPRLEQIRQKYADKGVRFVNVVGKMRKDYTTDEVLDLMKTLGSNLEVAHDEGNTFGRAFKARSFPTMIILGKTGNVEAMNVGNIGDLEKRATAQLDAIISGKPVPKFAEQTRRTRKRPDELVGKPAPRFSIQTLDGKPVSSDVLADSKATVLNFVATNCGYCGKQVPRLEKLRQEYEAKGVRFVNVVETMRTASTVDQVVQKMDSLGWKSEVAHDPTNKVGPLFNATGFPTMVVLGKTGKVEAANVGNIGDLETRVKGQLDAILAGNPVPKPAPTAPRTAQRKRPAQELVGKPVPEFSATTIDGKTISKADLKSHPAVVLNFVAPNCGYCKRQVPNVEKVRQKYESQGVRFVNVIQKMRKEYTTEEAVDIFKGAGSGLELSMSDFDSKDMGTKFKASSFPTLFVLGPDGKVADVTIGAKQDLETTLSAQLEKMIKAYP